ncbi:MAG: hypothetical protein ABI577_06190 [bacterium]
MDIRLSKARCRALVISCSDFRFVSAQRQARLDLGLENAYDLIARPGGVRQIVFPTSEAARVTMEEEIGLLYELHGFRRIVLMNHMTCGMYRDLSSRRQEEEVHREHLAQARTILRARFPGLAVETYLSVIVGDGVEVIAIDPATPASGRRASTRRA